MGLDLGQNLSELLPQEDLSSPLPLQLCAHMEKTFVLRESHCCGRDSNEGMSDF